jgi:hypothetical protein
MRQTVINAVHIHMGVNTTLNRAKDVMFRPSMEKNR